jgi:predicted outer membrane repeat protein
VQGAIELGVRSKGVKSRVYIVFQGNQSSWGGGGLCAQAASYRFPPSL